MPLMMEITGNVYSVSGRDKVTKRGVPPKLLRVAFSYGHCFHIKDTLAPPHHRIPTQKEAGYRKNKTLRNE